MTAVDSAIRCLKSEYLDRYFHCEVENGAIEITGHTEEDISKFDRFAEKHNMTTREYVRFVVLDVCVNRLYYDFSHALSGERVGPNRLVITERPWKRTILNCENGCAERCADEYEYGRLDFDGIQALVCSACGHAATSAPENNLEHTGQL